MTDHIVDARIVAARVRGDADKLARALRNIADNAARHASSSLSVTMSRDVVDATVTIMVADDGDGIPDGDKARVTERFVRLDASRQRGSGGSGLGLAIVSEIVRAHGGTVVITDADGGGAAVGFRLSVEQDLD